MTHHINWESISRGLDRMAQQQREQVKDLDETRRLLYMALAVPHTKRYNLAGTLTNALIHHSKVDIDPAQLLLRVVAAIDSDGDESVDWIWQEIDRITTDLEGPRGNGLE